MVFVLYSSEQQTQSIMSELHDIHFSQFEAAKSMILVMNYRFRLSVVEQLSEIGIQEYDDGLADREKLTEVFEHFVRLENDIVRSHRWTQAYTILELQYNDFKEYHKRYIEFLKNSGLYAKNKTSLSRDGYYYYKDKHDWLTKFV